MLGSRIPFRLAGSVPQVYARGHTLASPAALSRVNALSPSIAFTSRRTYATPGRPKGAVGEPTRTVKRAVKRVASEKKPTTTKKAATKPKAKAAPKKAAPKVLTEEQKTRAALKLQKAEIKDLKVAALAIPKHLSGRGHANAWGLFSGERTKAALGGGTTGNVRDALANQIKANAEAYKNISAAELEHYNHLANERNTQKKRGFLAWVQSHTAEEIRVANQARRKLRNRLTADKAKSWQNIEDERLVKRPLSPYAAFFAERMGSGDFRNIPPALQASKLIAQEWKALTDSEKAKYYDIHKQDIVRYNKEHLDAYGYPANTASVTASEE